MAGGIFDRGGDLFSDGNTNTTPPEYLLNQNLDAGTQLPQNYTGIGTSTPPDTPKPPLTDAQQMQRADLVVQGAGIGLDIAEGIASSTATNEARTTARRLAGQTRDDILKQRKKENDFLDRDLNNKAEQFQLNTYKMQYEMQQRQIMSLLKAEYNREDDLKNSAKKLNSINENNENYKDILLKMWG